MIYSWQNNLEAALERISYTATGSVPLHVYRAGGRIALAVPKDPRLTKIVIDLYQPQRLKGSAFKLATSMLSRTGKRLGAYTHSPDADLLPQIPSLQEPARAGSLGFLGCNPSHGLRCVIAGIDPKTGETFIAKLGLDESADAVRQEYESLLQLHHQFSGLVKPTAQESGDDWYLMRLPYLGNSSPSSMNLPAIAELLQSWTSNEVVRIDGCDLTASLIEHTQVNHALSGWHHKVGALKVSRALVHGDFAVWNLRNTKNGLFAIDWEWAEPKGIAGIDLIHGLRQEASMVRKLNAKAAIDWMLEQLKSDLWTPYLTRSGWSDHHLDLLRIGLLNSHHNAKNDSRELLAEVGIYLGA